MTIGSLASIRVGAILWSSGFATDQEVENLIRIIKRTKIIKSESDASDVIRRKKSFKWSLGTKVDPLAKGAILGLKLEF